MNNDNKNIDNKTVIYLAIIVFVLMVIFVIVGSNSTNVNYKNNDTIKEVFYNINEEVKTDCWQIQILSVDNKSKVNDGYNIKETTNNYLLIKMKLKNISNNPASPTRSIKSITNNSIGVMTSSIFEINNGVSNYYTNNELEMYIPNNYLMLWDTINPNTEVEYTAVIETDKQSTECNYILEVHDDSSYVTKIKLY